MAYEKTNWQVGDTITAIKLNKIEDQVAANEEAIASASGGDNVFIVNINASSSDGSTVTATADKTIEEVTDAWEAGNAIIFRAKYQVGNNPYNVYCFLANASLDGASNQLDFSGYKVTYVSSNSEIVVVTVGINHSGTVSFALSYVSV